MDEKESRARRRRLQPHMAVIAAHAERLAGSPIPHAVLRALDVVRLSGVTNMLARITVINEMLDADEDDEDAREASLWLEDNDDRYMEALNAMGARRAP